MKKLIIVCEDKLKHYGDFLAQLISNADDAADKIVGIPDGSAAAQVWSEKEYAANAAQISSEQYILFIGNSKLLKEKRLHMQIKCSEYGMNYGWLGKQSVLYVDRTVSHSEYEEFYQLACKKAFEGSQPEIAKLIASENTGTAGTGSMSGVAHDQDTAEASANAEKLNKVLKLMTPIIVPSVHITTKVTDSLMKVSDDLIKKKKIKDQEYACLTLLFYLNDLKAFLGLGEQ